MIKTDLKKSERGIKNVKTDKKKGERWKCINLKQEKTDKKVGGGLKM